MIHQQKYIIKCFSKEAEKMGRESKENATLNKQGKVCPSPAMDGSETHYSTQRSLWQEPTDIQESKYLFHKFGPCGGT